MMTNTARAHIVLSPESKDLIDRCLDEDRQAQKQLYEQYAQAMFTLAYRITSNHELAHDSLQDAFIEVFRDLKTFRRTSTLGAWIKTIVLRKATKNIKFENRYAELKEANESLLTIAYHHFDGQLLEKAISSLPEGCRTIFTLVEIEGYKHTEVAEILKISAGTSRSQLHHAKQILKKQLKERE